MVQANAFKLGLFLDETGEPFERAVEVAQELGAGYAEFFVRDANDLTETKAAIYRRRLDECGLRAHAVGFSPNPFKTIHLDQIALQDVPTHANFRHDMDVLRRSMDFAGIVGSPNVLVQRFAWPGEYEGSRRVSPTWSQRYAGGGGAILPAELEKLARAFGTVADLAERHNVDVAIGMMPWNYTNTSRNFVRIMKRVGSPRLRARSISLL